MKNSKTAVLSVLLCALLLILMPLRVVAAPEDEEFNGPFPNWLNVKTDFGAVGDGVTDDTAAIQAALDTSLTRQFIDSGGRVVYLPAGTYRITSTLMVPTLNATINPNRKSQNNSMIIGQDPATTTIKWGGADNGVMAYINGVNAFGLSRLTWDGNSKAQICVRHEWDKLTGNYSTNNQHSDEVFKNAKYGIWVTDWTTVNNGQVVPGQDQQGDAECALYRCQFLNLTEAGLRIDPGNAYDWWVWYSRFSNCKVGIMNTSGNFCAFNNVFANSTESDLKVGDARYFAARDNFSSGSNRFLTMDPQIGHAGTWVLQSNRIIDPIQTDAIQYGGGSGFISIYDNTVASKSAVTQGPVIVQKIPGGFDFQGGQEMLCLGNTFTVPNPLETTVNQAYYLDNTTTTRGTVSTTAPVLPGTPPQVARQVFEIADILWSDSVAGTRAIQDAIDQAAAYARANPGSRPVVHLGSKAVAGNRGGIWSLNASLVVPANVQMTILGDFQGSTLRVYGPDGIGANQPALLLRGPSRVTVRDLQIGTTEAPNTPGIIVDNCDQVGARIYTANFKADFVRDCGVFVNGLVNAKVNMHNTQIGGDDSVRVLGGTSAGLGRVALFGMASSNAPNTLFLVEGGGNLLARDYWYESNNLSEMLRCTGSSAQTSKVALECAYVFNAGNTSYPGYVMDSFKGSVALTCAKLGSNTKFTGSTTDLKYLSVGSNNQLTSDSAAAANALTLSGPQYGSTGRQSPAFLRQMLDFQRTVKPELIDTLPNGVTDVRFLGVVTNGTTGLTLLPDAFVATPSTQLPGVNLVTNPGFEKQQYNTQSPLDWREWSTSTRASGYTESSGGSHGGNYHGTHLSVNNYNMYTYQTKAGLANGLYTLRAWARSSGGQTTCQLGAKDFGSAPKVADLPVSSSYQLVEIKDINVTNGQCTIGVWSDAFANNYCYFDDVEFFKQ